MSDFCNLLKVAEQDLEIGGGQEPLGEQNPLDVQNPLIEERGTVIRKNTSEIKIEPVEATRIKLDKANEVQEESSSEETQETKETQETQETQDKGTDDKINLSFPFYLSGVIFILLCIVEMITC